MDATGLLKSDTCMHALTALYSTRDSSRSTRFFQGGEICTAIRCLPKVCHTACCCNLYGLQKLLQQAVQVLETAERLPPPSSFNLPSAADFAGLSLGPNSGSTPPLLHAPLPVKNCLDILLVSGKPLALIRQCLAASLSIHQVTGKSESLCPQMAAATQTASSSHCSIGCCVP